ncbi:MAG: hypothetical protein JXA82_05785 [Sedimentisphaerales bacterium]|nr:hypothetical protein [Sedimentisphaerales bacterium]
MPNKIAILCGIVLVISLVPLTPAGTYSGGTGDPNDPFQIGTVANWLELIDTSSDWDKSFILVNDIDFEGVPLTPIAPDLDPLTEGFQGVGFSGVFEGNNHTICNVKIQPDFSDYVALFGLLRINSQIRNLCIKDGEIKGHNHVGGICGFNGQGRISHIFVTCKVTGYRSIGGICGTNYYGSITQSYAIADVTGNFNIGGLSGGNWGDIFDCYTGGSSNCKDDSQRIGGLCGENLGRIKSCYSTVAVAGGYNPGGLCGMNEGIISLCFWDVETSGQTVSAGGYGMTTLQLLQEVTYIGWNNGNWTIDEGNDYPRLAWENKPGKIIENEHLRSYIGNGVDQPFEIATPEDIFCMSRRPDDWDKKFLLACDIDMKEVDNYWPIAEFSGNFDGCMNVIRNIKIDSLIIGNRSQLGLIGTLNAKGQILNLELEEVSVISTDCSNSLGNLCGRNFGDIHNCCVLGNVTGGENSRLLGVLCGENFGEMSNCYAEGTVSSGINSSLLGGLTGTNAWLINKCNVNSVVIGGNDSDFLGGLTGTNGGQITNCYVTSSIMSGQKSMIIGGMCGASYLISKCHVDSVIFWQDGSYVVGGLVGINAGTIFMSYATGTINGDERVAGLCSENNGTINSSYAICEVNGNIYVGGLCGINRGSISHSYSNSIVGGNDDVGALCGYNNGNIGSCFWDKETSGIQISAGGIDLTTEDMQMISTFTDAGWDFVGETTNGTEDIWRMCVDGVDYPRLAWEFSRGGDLTCPDGVMLEDLLYLADRWQTMTSETIGAADTDGDGKVTFSDFVILSENWLKMP